jgi:hypothetical protein
MPNNEERAATRRERKRLEREQRKLMKHEPTVECHFRPEPRLSRIAKAVVSLIVTIVLGGSLSTTWTLVSPPIEFQALPALADSDPFSVAFSIANKGLYPAYDIKFVCQLHQTQLRSREGKALTILGSANLVNSSVETERPILTSGDRFTETCAIGFMEGKRTLALALEPGMKVESSDITVSISFSPALTPWGFAPFRRTARQSYDGRRYESGFRWLERADSEAMKR